MIGYFSGTHTFCDEGWEGEADMCGASVLPVDAADCGIDTEVSMLHITHHIS